MTHLKSHSKYMAGLGFTLKSDSVFPLLYTVEPPGTIGLFHGRGTLPRGLDPGKVKDREIMNVGTT